MFETEVNNFILSLISQGIIINGRLTEVNEDRKTAVTIIYMINTETDRVDELYFYVWKPSDTILYKQMDRLPTRY